MKAENQCHWPKEAENKCHWPKELPFLEKLQCTTVSTYTDSVHGTEVSHGSKGKRL